MMVLENIRDRAIGISVAILLPLIFTVGVRLVLQQPSYPEGYNHTHASEAMQQEHQSKLAVYEAQQKTYEKYYFYITTLASIIAIMIGLVTPIPFLGMGFILGGVLSLVRAYFRYWGEMHDLFKFASLLLALVLLIIASYRFTRDRK